MKSFTIQVVLLQIALLGYPSHAFVAPLTSPKRTTVRQHHSLLFSAAVEMATPKATVQEFSFQGYKIYSEVYTPTTNKKRNNHVILIHGFGCSTKYWRATIDTFQQAGYTVHALDLLGQGQSDKPTRKDGIEYSVPLWAQQIEQYAQAFVPSNQGIVLIGNSLGSLVALTATAGGYEVAQNTAFPNQAKGIGMFNCGIGMNSRNLLQEYEGLQKVVFKALLDVFDALIYSNVPLLTYVLDQILTPELLRSALTGLYKYGPERVDDELVEYFYRPAKDPGAPDCLSQICTNDPGATPMEIYGNYGEKMKHLPVHLVWGTDDKVAPIEGPVGIFFSHLASDPNTKVSFDTIEAGHIPFDEVPECNQLMLKWLEDLDKTSSRANVVVAPEASKKFFGYFKLPFF